jgi:hypothetical protein
MGPAARAMESATEAAVAALGGERPSAETLAAAQARAAELLRSGDGAGMRDLQNLQLAMSLPAVRCIFRGLVAASGLRGAAKQDALKEIADFSPVTEEGCYSVDFYNKTTGAADRAFLVLRQCGRRHDLQAQLDKLRPHVADEKWPEILRHLSMLVFLARSTYATLARAHLGLLRRLRGLPADDPCAAWLALRVDGANTTLFVDAELPNRAGIFVYLAHEVDRAAAPI